MVKAKISFANDELLFVFIWQTRSDWTRYVHTHWLLIKKIVQFVYFRVDSRKKKTETNPREFQRKKRLSKKKNIDLDFWSRSANQWIHAVSLLWHPAKIKLRVTRHTQHSTLFLAQITNQNHRQLHSTWYNSNSRAKVTAAQPFCLTLAIMCLRTRACSLTRSFISSPGDQKPFGWNYRNSTANNRRGEAKKKSIDK